MADSAARASCAIALAAAILASTGSLGVAPALAATPVPNASAKTLAKYHSLMAMLPKPENMVFDYSEVRSGPTRITSATHRVYRDKDGDQRNDTTVIDDTPVRPPQTRTYQRAVWPYFADQFDVPASDYDVKFAGAAYVDGRKAYVYRAKRIAPAPFAVTEIALDPQSGAPLREQYDASSGDCQGSGEIDFIQVGAYVLPSTVSAQCTSSSGGQFKHTIRFSNYSFPAAIPKDVLHPSGAT